MNTDVEWEKLGKTDPYFGVITHEKFRSQNFNDDAKKEFFDSGKGHVDHVLAICRRHLDQGFSPKTVLDFGCGTGRLVIPFAQMAEEVVGLDVSESMLNEASKNCIENSVTNVRLMRSDDNLSCLHERFDFIHSYIVFQHIPVARGKVIFSKLLNHLDEGGIGAVHFLYSKAIYAEWGGVPQVEASSIRKSLRSAKRFLKSLFFKTLARQDPEIQMNPYNLNKLFFIMQSEGISNFHAEFTDHGGEFGLILYFQKPKRKTPH